MLDQDLELISHLDDLGYAEAWVGEHHSTGWENIAAPEAFIAAAAERTENIRLGTGVIQAGLHHPLVALDRAIFLDHLTKGRSAFGIGVGGGLPSDLEVFGLSPAQAGKRLGESISAMERLLYDQGPVSMNTDWFELRDAVLQLRPFTEPHMPIAMATSNPENIETLGRLGGYVLTGPIPERVEMIHESLELGAAKVGREASRGQIMLSYAMHLAPTREEAVQSFRKGAITEQYDFNVAVNGRPRPEGDPDAWYDTFVGRNLIGSPEDAVAKVEEIVEVSGGVGGILFTSRDWAGRQAALESWKLFADEVAPRFASEPAVIVSPSAH